MGFKCGLVGMPNVGKSSIFNLLTKQSIPANNYPFCTIDPNNAFVEVPDERLSKLSKINNSKKTVNAAIEFVDIAGLIKGPVYTNDLVIKETGSIIGPVETDKIEIHGHLEGKVVAKTIVIGSSAVVKGDILFSETLKTEEGADINGYIKKTESTSLEAAQDEFKLEAIEAKEREKEKSSKKGRPKIVASN